MAGNRNGKLKLLYLMEIFLMKTDEAHILTSAELCHELELCGVTAERKSIYSDIDALRAFGIEIVHARIPKNGYFLAKRIFELADLRLMMDSVYSASFISEEQTEHLINKIVGLASNSQAESLRQQVCVANVKKCTGNDQYYNIAMLQRAIQTKHFVYFHYVTRHLTSLYDTQEQETDFLVYPLQILWQDGYYELRCEKPDQPQVYHLRIDRMRRLHLVEERTYASMHRSREIRQEVPDPEIEIRCKNNLLEDALRFFGEKVPLRLDGSDAFRLRTVYPLDEPLFSWLFQHGEDVEVLSPKQLRVRLLEHVNRIAKQYGSA